MPGCSIAHIDVRNPEGFQRHREQVSPLSARFGGRSIVPGGEVRPLEGDRPIRRLVVLEFPSIDDAQRFCDGPEYRPSKRLRRDSSMTDVLRVSGYAP
jgi:uncharacterized protein (DUF1330 family)